MTNEFYEWFSHRLADLRMRCDYIRYRKQWKQHPCNGHGKIGKEGKYVLIRLFELLSVAINSKFK